MPKRPNIKYPEKIEWGREAIDAALSCMYSPKTYKAQKNVLLNMKDALEAAWNVQRKEILKEDNNER